MFPLFETFIAVYETKSFTRASKYLFISQPTVTVRIRKLEEELGTSLFSRGQNQEVIPTEAAMHLYAPALKYIKSWEKLQAEIQEKQKKNTPLRLVFHTVLQLASCQISLRVLRRI